MRPLYIDGTPGCRVVLDEPALRIVVPDQSDRLFPLSRISKVVCNGCVDWSMSALLACADAGINLYFLQKNGEIRARWMGQTSVRLPLTQQVADLLVRPDGYGRYENWLLSMEKLAVRSFARRIGIVEWREIPVADMRKQILLIMSPELLLRLNLLLAIVQGEVVVWLKDSGFLCEDESVINSELDLAGDISKLLLWDCYESLLDGGSTDTAPLPEMATFFQNREDRLFLLFKSTMSKFIQFLHTVP